MKSLRFEDVSPDATLQHAVLRGHPRLSGVLPNGLCTPARLVDGAHAAAARDLPRSELASAIRARLELLGAPEESLAAAERIATPGTVVVVAGQQPVLFGGPHLVVSKALAAVAAARRLEDEHGIPAVPVFWNADEDHDHGEADHVSSSGEGGASHRWRLPLPGDRRMLAAVPLPDSAGELARNFTETLGAAGGQLRDVLAPAPEDSFGTWTARILLRLLGRFGVVLVEPSTLRPFAREVVRRELAVPGELAATIKRVESRLVAAGYGPPLNLARPELFFCVEDGVRMRAAYDGSGFRISMDRRAAATDLLEELEGDPSSFSWNVATRVLAQDVALPVAGQVCGPTELTYFALLEEAHGLVGVALPAAVPRPGCTLVDARTRRAADAVGVDPADVVSAGDGAFPAEGVTPAGDVAGLRAAVSALPEARSQAVRRRRDAIARAVDLYAEAVERERRARSDTVEGRRLRILNALRPAGRLQERTMSILPWVARHGPAVLDRMLDAYRDGTAEHVVLDVDREE